jgi:hypothetical protein
MGLSGLLNIFLLYISLSGVTGLILIISAVRLGLPPKSDSF